MHPKKFFSDMPTKAPIREPFIFALICGSASIIISALVNIIVVLSGAQPANLPPGSSTPSNAALIGSYVTLGVISPVLVAAGVFIGAGLYNLVVFLFGGREGFRATFRVLSYTNALAVFNVVPFLGPIFVTIYSVVLFSIGFKSAHKMGTLKAVMAALLPMLVLFIIGFFIAFFMASQGALPAFNPQAVSGQSGAISGSAPAAPVAPPAQ